MGSKRYTVVTPEVSKDHVWSVHKLGCADVKKELAARGGYKETLKLDLDDEAAVMALLDPDDLGYEIFDVKVFPCTNARQEKKPAPAGSSAATTRNGRKVSTGTSRAGEREVAVEKKRKALLPWQEERLPGCDDATYEKAVQVRTGRANGEPWWRIAQIMELPGFGASAAQGKAGAGQARRLWEKAWGKTYSGDRAPRDTRQRREERSLTEAHRSYFTGEELEMEIIKEVCGKLLHWVTRLGDAHGGVVTSAQEAHVHHDPRTIIVRDGPKGRYVEFWEALDPAMLTVDPHLSIAKSGPRRAVYLDRITRVGA
jgi:hypothetical protein